MLRYCYIAAPAFLVGYGVVRLIDGLDGSHGPGPAWTIGHLLFLVAMGLFGVVLFGLRREVSRLRPLATAAVAAGLVGLLAFVRVILVDLIVGAQSADRAEMDRLYDRYDGFPGGLPGGVTNLLDGLGPTLFVLALVVLTVQLVLRRRLAWWSPVLVLVGFTAITLDLDLLPLAGCAIGLALLPMARPTRSGLVPAGPLVHG